MSSYASVPTPTENALVEISTDGGSVWKFLPGVASVNDSGGDSPTRERSTFQNVVQLVGQARPPTIEVTLPALAPGHSTYSDLHTAYVGGTNIHLRYRFLEQILFQAAVGTTVAISMAGVVTQNTGGGVSHADLNLKDFGPGAAFKTGTTPRYDVIESITSAGVPTCKAATAALVAAVYAVVIAPFYRPSVLGRVSSFGNVSADSESEVGTTLTLAARSALPALQIGAPA